jgi:YD repeat-containing protein
VRLLPKSVVFRTLALSVFVSILATASARADDCVEFGGKRFCGAPKPTPFTYGACDEQGANLFSDAAWCFVSGGTSANTGCPGATPHTEDNIEERSVQFTDVFLGQAGCSIVADTGWGTTFTTNFCVGGGDVYGGGFGILTATNRRLQIGCPRGGMLISLRKQRGLQCPPGYTIALNPSNGQQECSRPLECCDNGLGNPVTPGTGVKLESDVDYRHPLGLEFTRYYHSYQFYEPFSRTPGVHTENRLGPMWRTGFDKRIIVLDPASTFVQTAISLPNGDVQYFDTTGKEIFNYRGESGTLLTVAGTGYFYNRPDRTEFYGVDGRLRSISLASGQILALTYSDGTTGPNGGVILDAAGNPRTLTLPLPANSLIRVADAQGNTLSFGYDIQQRIVVMTDPGGGQTHYSYDQASNLTSVTYPDGSARSYRYNEPANMIDGASLGYALTSIVDENGNLHASFKYDASGRAVSTEHAGGAERYQLTYNAGNTGVTDALGTARTFNFTVADGITRLSANSLPGGAGFGTGIQGQTYDAGSNLSSKTDFNSNKTCYAYDTVRNLETVRVEGLPADTSCEPVPGGSGAALPAGGRRTVTEWHARWRMPVLIAEPQRRTTYVYNGDAGALCAPASAVIADGSASGQPIGVLCSKKIESTADPDGASDNTTWTKAAVSVCHNSSCSQVFTDVAYVSQYDPRGACAAAAALTFWFPSTSFGGARGAGNSGECFYNDTFNRRTPAFGSWQVVSGCVSGTFPNQVFTALNSGGCVPPSGGAEPRTWSYTYDSNGHVLTADGPRTDVSDITTTTYYADDDPDPGKRGNVASVTNALGHVISITAYNAHGQPLTIVDPNGLATNLGYDLRHRLISRDVGGEVTSYDYDGAGQMTKVTLPDGSSLAYGYDAAHRLTGMSDNLGNRIAYTLDAMGNRTQEQVFDPANALAQTRSRVYNNLNQLFQELGAQNQTTQYAYDNQGNVTSVTDPLTHTTSNQYDALNRLIRVTDPNLGQTQYAYNGIDQLVRVTDPRNLATRYNYDGLSNLNSLVSPDTGTTFNTYDTAGNLLTQTDAKGQVTTRAYDELNRVTFTAFADGSVQAYGYDLGANGIGRLTSITELNQSQQITSTLTYTYDQHGRTTSETRTINSVAYVLAYRYDNFGRLAGMTYPSGRTIAYSFDTLGRVSEVKTTPLGGSEQSVASSIAYQPFGGVKSYMLGNGQTYTRGFDLDGRIASYSQGAQTFAIGYDAASRVSFITDTANAANSNTYSYDNLDRLIGAVLPNLPYAYDYDAVGNRTSKTVGSSTDTYAYSPTSNRISSITEQAGAVRNFAFDANGSTTADGNNLYGYDARGRMVQSTGALGATTYQTNALGQRIRKTNASDDRVFLYDTRGRLIAETDPGGGLKREYLYLNDIPLAVIQ